MKHNFYLDFLRYLCAINIMKEKRKSDMGNPLVSIIVPAYNAEKFIDETVRSALATRYVPIEILIVNDGSSDATLNILEKIAEEHDIVRVYTDHQ